MTPGEAAAALAGQRGRGQRINGLAERRPADQDRSVVKNRALAAAYAGGTGSGLRCSTPTRAGC